MGALGANLGALGANLRPSWSQLGANLGGLGRTEEQFCADCKNIEKPFVFMRLSMVSGSLLELLEPKLSTFGPTWELLGPTWGQLERMLGGSGPTWAVLAAPGRQVGAGRQVDLGQLGARWELDGQGDRSYGFSNRKVVRELKKTARKALWKPILKL